MNILRRERKGLVSAWDSLSISTEIHSQVKRFQDFLVCWNVAVHLEELATKGKELADTTHFIQPCARLPWTKGTSYINFIKGGKPSAKLINFWALGVERREVLFKGWGINLLLCSNFSLLKGMIYNDNYVPRSWCEWLKDSLKWHNYIYHFSNRNIVQ